MGCCLFAILSALWPRVILLAIWFLWPAVPKAAFQSELYPLLGFIFVPTTTLAYELIKYNNGGAIDGWWLILLALAFLHDIGHVGAGMRRKRVVVVEKKS